MANIGVVGAGYVGLVTSACLANLGHTVVCVEINEERLNALQQEQIPIYEPGLAEMVIRSHREGRLSFTNAASEMVPEADFIFLAVNTPPSADGTADTSYVFAAVDSILEHAHPGQIIVVKST